MIGGQLFPEKPSVAESNIENTGNKLDSRESMELKNNIGEFFDRLSDKLDAIQKGIEEKTDRLTQDKEIALGLKNIDNLSLAQKGNLGEMVLDRVMEKFGYIRISGDRVTSLDGKGHQGIDGVYYKEGGHPPYIIADAKFGTAQLNPSTGDGRQMSADWINKRLDQAVGKEKADIIREEDLKGNVGAYTSHINKDGNVTFDKLDNSGNVTERNVRFDA